MKKLFIMAMLGFSVSLFTMENQITDLAYAILQRTEKNVPDVIRTTKAINFDAIGKTVDTAVGMVPWSEIGTIAFCAVSLAGYSYFSENCDDENEELYPQRDI